MCSTHAWCTHQQGNWSKVTAWSFTCSQPSHTHAPKLKKQYSCYAPWLVKEIRFFWGYTTMLSVTMHFCRQNSLHLLTIPLHSSHNVQLLDTHFFKPLTDSYAQACDKWLLNNTGSTVTQFHITEIFCQACGKCAIMGKGMNGFKLWNSPCYFPRLHWRWLPSQWRQTNLLKQ